MKRNKKEEEEILGLRRNWYFVVMAAFLAVFVSIACNAAYDILVDLRVAKWLILLLFGGGAILTGHMFTTFFEHFKEERKIDVEHDKTIDFLRRYWRYIKEDREANKVHKRSSQSKDQ